MKKITKMKIQSIWNCQNGSFYTFSVHKSDKKHEIFTSKNVQKCNLMSLTIWKKYFGNSEGLKCKISPKLKVLSLKFGQNEKILQSYVYIYSVGTLCTIIWCQNYIPLSSLLDSVFRSKMKSRAELKIMLEFFLIFALMLLFHSLFVILSSSSFFSLLPSVFFFFFWVEKKICNKKNNFLSHALPQCVPFYEAGFFFTNVRFLFTIFCTVSELKIVVVLMNLDYY